MALFHKKPQTNSSAPLYTLGMNKTVLVVGLGNMGDQYKMTRHNIGFMCADYFADSQNLGTWVTKKDLHCQLITATVGDTRVITIKPTTFMNNSGYAVQLVSQFYKIKPSDIVVVQDELDVQFGEIRTKTGGGSAGHNGIKSIVEHIGEDFGRVRIGVGNSLKDNTDSADFVLAKFSKDEQAQIELLQKEVSSLLIERIASGIMPDLAHKWLV